MTYTVSSGTLNSSIPYHSYTRTVNLQVFKEKTLTCRMCIISDHKHKRATMGIGLRPLCTHLTL